MMDCKLPRLDKAEVHLIKITEEQRNYIAITLRRIVCMTSLKSLNCLAHRNCMHYALTGTANQVKC